MSRKKRAQSVAIIGGADGPTSIFIAGKRRGNLRDMILGIPHRMRRAKAKRQIRPGVHSLKSVAGNLVRKWGAYELPKDSMQYQEERSSMKESLIIQKCPELLGDAVQINPPEDGTPESFRKFLEQLERRKELAEQIPEEEFPLDFHIYQIDSPDGGNMQVTIEYRWEELSVSYSGNKREMRRFQKMSRMVYLYWGVTEKDVAEKSQRYKAVLAALT